MLYYYPNRPILIPPDPQHPLNPAPDYLNSLEAEGKWTGELKWNGDNALIDTDTLEFWNRTRKKLRYVLSDAVREELEQWPKGCVLNAELVHYKTKDVKDTIIVHCIMRWKGKYLIGKTWGDSRRLLNKQPSGKHVQVSKTFKKGFWKKFQEADGKVIEGIILKDPSGLLVFSATPIPDVSWMRKIRKPCKKYNF